MRSSEYLFNYGLMSFSLGSLCFMSVAF